MRNQVDLITRKTWAIVRVAARTFVRIDATEWAGAFAFNAFFSLFPLMILLVTLASVIVDRDRAGMAVIAYVEAYLPIRGDMQSYIFDTVAGVIKARKQASALALFILLWVTSQCFTSLISATNRAWGIAGYSWWRPSLKSLALLGITTGVVLLSIGLPIVAQLARDRLFPSDDFHAWVYALASFCISVLVVFLSLSVFYRLAPRRPTRFAEVWAASLLATGLLLATENLFVLYLKEVATLNAVYGAFGGIMALLMWIYVSGGIFIYGACVCAAQAEVRAASADNLPARDACGDY
ncbi:MAG: YihY/virulence factor BrkB family protein [Hydrogenophilales bacterium]|nr:YihY/virulence factor BrkB family protein [Hydrogenophilales bacterium]